MYPANRVGQLADVQHAVLEEVPAAFLASLEQAQGVLSLDVLRKDENAHAGPASADRLRSDESLIRVRGRHANVYDRHVRSLALHATQKLVGRRDLRDHVETLVREQPGDPLP